MMRDLLPLHLLRRILAQPAAGRYLVVGGSVYLLELAVIVLAEHAGLSTVWAVSLSYSIGVIVSFLLQKLFTFRDRRMHHRIVAGQAVAVGLLLVWNYAFTMGMVALLDKVLPGVVIRTIALGITTIWNFYLYKTRIFRRDPKPATDAKQPTDNGKTPGAKRHKADAPAVPPATGSGKQSFDAKEVVASVRRLASRYVRLSLPALPFGLSRTYVALAASAFLLLTTTCVWSVLGARVQTTNADQFIDPYLFGTYETFHGAVFPGAHTFLFKWPLFAVSSAFGNSSSVLIVLTCLVSLLTVGALMYLLLRIEKRPLVLALYYCVLSILLLQIPPQPHPGALLPTNMAMLTTRNLEYIAYIGGLALLFRAKKIRSVHMVAAVGVLTMLFASDRLFAGLSIGGASMSVALLYLRRAPALTKLMLRWLAASIAAFALSIILLGAIRLTGVTQINGSEQSPYSFTQTPKQFAVAVLYLVHGTMTQLGANPSYDAMELHSFGGSLRRNLVSIGAPAYLASLGAAGVMGYTVVRHLWQRVKTRPSPKQKKARPIPQDAPLLLTAALASTSLATAGLFVLTDHYYPADSRYLTIIFFALIIGYATAARKRMKVRLARNLLIAATVCLPFALVNMIHIYDRQLPPAQSITANNTAIHDTLRAHAIQQLVGDYWRVIPARLDGGSFIRPVSLGDCVHPREVLTSGQWKLDRKKPFAYVLRTGPGLAGAKQCTLKTVIEAFGQPYDVVRLPDGQERLLLYSGANGMPVAGQGPQRALSHMLPKTTCSGGSTSLSIIAHQDDDLLFMNPDTYNFLLAGDCVRTVYLTTGDAGAEGQYESMRVKGAKAAYEAMLGESTTWRQGFLRLPTGQRVSFLEGYGPGSDIGSPEAMPQVTLLLFHLPDGNIMGSGYSKDKYASLRGIIDGSKPNITAFNGSVTYSAGQLTEALAYIMSIYSPTYIQTFNVSERGIGGVHDHSDHIASGILAKRAVRQYIAHKSRSVPAPQLRLYTGYPIQKWPENLDESAQEQKQRIFLKYAQYDGAVCQTAEACRSGHNAYTYYLPRQYRQEEAE